jgi:hypothetical protein
MALAEDMLWICMSNKGLERAKALLDSNTRRQEYVLEVELINGVFQSIYTNFQKKLMVNSLRSLDQKPTSAQHNANTSPFISRSTDLLAQEGS